MRAISQKMRDYCLAHTKNQAPKYLRLPYVIFNDTNLIVPIGTGNESAIRSFKLAIKEKFRKSHDILGYTELILYSNVSVSIRDSLTAADPLDRPGMRKGVIQGICYQK